MKRKKSSKAEQQNDLEQEEEILDAEPEQIEIKHEEVGKYFHRLLF